MFFSIDRFNEMPVVKSIMEFNPLYNVLHLARETLLYGGAGGWRAWVILTLWSFLALAVGMIVFWRGEETYGREL
jgi:teichoic acid transport system permease protein